MTSVVVNEATQTVVVTEGDGITVVSAPSPAVVVQVDDLGPQGPGGVLGLYGSFIDTTDQPIVQVDVAQALSIGTTVENRGVTLSNQSRINFSLAGTYKALVSLQITNSSNNQAEVDIFFKLNGVTIANSNTRIDLEPRKSIGVPYHDCFTVEFQLTVAKDDYLQVWWLADSLDIAIDTIPANATHPQAPGAIVNVAQVMYAQTGIPPAGNIGDLIVKASGSDYDTAWTDAPTVDKLGLDTTAAESVTTGQIAWNATEGTIDVGLLHGTVNQVGQEVQLLCKNTAASITITDGMGVMFTGADPVTLRLEVQPMQADGSLPGYVFLGVATQSIAPGDEGYVTTFGKVRDIDTSAYAEDAILWCDPVNPGGFVTVEPISPNLKIAAAAVIKSNSTTGAIMVRAETGQNLSDCHDVEVDTAQDADYLGWSEDMQHWMPLTVPNVAPRSITIAGPQIGDSFTLFRTTRSTTITSAVALVSGGSVTYELRYAADRSTTGTLATVSDTVTNTTTGDSATVQNQPIAASRYVWVEITGVTGTVDEFNLSVAF